MEKCRLRDLSKLVKKLLDKGVTLGEFLQEVKFIEGVTYSTMSDILGVSKSHISNIVQGKQVSESLYLVYVAKLDEVLKFDIEEMLGQWD